MAWLHLHTVMIAIRDLVYWVKSLNAQVANTRILQTGVFCMKLKTWPQLPTKPTVEC